MNKFPVIFFDLGNTLLYFDGDWPHVLDKSSHALALHLRGLGYEIDQQRFIKSFGRHVLQQHLKRDIDMVEEPAERILARELSTYGFPDVPNIHLREALDQMFAISQKYWHIEEDCLTMLEVLQSNGYRLAIISNAKDQKDIQQLLEKANIIQFFEAITISCDIGYRKPHPYIFRAALNKMDIEPLNCVMVGDLLEADIAGAKNIGMKSVWIKRRAKEVKPSITLSSTPDFIIQALSEIPYLITQLD